MRECSTIAIVLNCKKSSLVYSKIFESHENDDGEETIPQEQLYIQLLQKHGVVDANGSLINNDKNANDDSAYAKEREKAL